MSKTIGETGSFTGPSPGADVPIRINFTEMLDNPIIALTGTGNGADMYSIRVTETTDTYFEFLIEEWEYLDGPHPAVETVNWIAINSGTHRLEDGRFVEAGTTSANETNTAVTYSSEFQAEIDSNPIVLTSVMSNNDDITVDSDPLNITTSGFNVRLQEEEAQNPANTHAFETVGWIAFESGGDADTAGLAQTGGGLDEGNDVYTFDTAFTGTPIVVADTQTINGGDTARVELVATGSTTVTLNLQEEQSNDSEIAHIDETVGFVAFDAGLITAICFTPEVRLSTPAGERAVRDLREGDLVVTADHGLCPIRWIGGKLVTGARLHAAPQARPIVIPAGALGLGRPTREVRVSPRHCLALEGGEVELAFGTREVLVAALHLVGWRGIHRDDSCQATEYLHLLMDKHEILFADGLPAESYHPGQQGMATLKDQDRARLLMAMPRITTDAYGPTARRVLRWHEAVHFAPTNQRDASIAAHGRAG